jgi:hypothetical protein
MVFWLLTRAARTLYTEYLLEGKLNDTESIHKRVTNWRIITRTFYKSENKNHNMVERCNDRKLYSQHDYCLTNG